MPLILSKIRYELFDISSSKICQIQITKESVINQNYQVKPIWKTFRALFPHFNWNQYSIQKESKFFFKNFKKITQQFD